MALFGPPVNMDAKSAKRSADVLLAAVKEYRSIEATGSAVISSLCNLLGRSAVLAPKAAACKGITLHPPCDEPSAAPVHHSSLSGGASETLLMFGDIFQRVLEVHIAEAEKQIANLRTVVNHLDAVMFRLMQPMAEIEKSMKRAPGAGLKSSMGSPVPRTPVTSALSPLPRPSPAPTSPALRPPSSATATPITSPSASDTVPGMLAADVLRAAMDLYVFLEADIARKKLLIAVCDPWTIDHAQTLEKQWECDRDSGGGEGAAWRHVLELALRIAGTVEAVS